jgi:tetratricopeptide (TPR) repeat protein
MNWKIIYNSKSKDTPRKICSKKINLAFGVFVLILHEISVSFRNETGDWEDVETFKISSNLSDSENGVLFEKTALAEAALQTGINKVGRLPSGVTFLLVDKVVEYNLEDYISDVDKLKTVPDEELIKIGNRLPELILKAIEIPEGIINLCNLIITAKLNNEELSSCISYLEELKVLGIEVGETIAKLINLQMVQGALEIDNITDVKILNKISGLYRDLKALKKAKTILLKSLDMDDRNSVTLNRLGGVCRASCSYEEGISYYKKSLNIRPNPYAFNGLGGIYRDINELVLAVESYLAALPLANKEDQSKTHRGLGAVYYDLELYDEGNIHFRLAGFDENALFEIFFDAKKRKLNEKAVEVLKLILEFDEYNSRAKWLINKESLKKPWYINKKTM